MPDEVQALSAEEAARLEALRAERERRIQAALMEQPGLDELVRLEQRAEAAARAEHDAEAARLAPLLGRRQARLDEAAEALDAEIAHLREQAAREEAAARAAFEAARERIEAEFQAAKAAL